jgi:glutathione peroxidase-family protein
MRNGTVKIRKFKFSQIHSLTIISLQMSFYDIVEKDANGELVSFDKFRGQVLYGVNVASACGYTAGGYALLAKLAKIPGAQVLLFPCNQVSICVLIYV